MPTDLMEGLKVLAPLGVGGVLALVIFWFHHREFVKKVNSTREDRERMIEVVAKNAVVGERMAQAIHELSETMERSEQARQRQLEILLQTVAGRRRVREENNG